MRFRPKLLFIITLIIALGLFLRLWRFEELFYYAIDEEKAAYITSSLANLKHFPAAGHPSSIGFRLGPLFYYLTTPIYRFFSPEPLSIGYLSVAASIFSILLLYKIASKINPKTGLIASFLYSVSFLNVIYERRGWQLSFESAIILVLIYSLLRLIKGSLNYIVPFTLSLILMTQLEVGLFTFIPFSFLVFVIYRIKPDKKLLLISLFLFIIANSGLLIFDLRHNFLNSRYLLNYFRRGNHVRIAENKPLTDDRSIYLAHRLIPATLARTLYPSGGNNLTIQYANCPQYLGLKHQTLPDYFIFSTSLFLIYFLYRSLRLIKATDDGLRLLFLSGLFMLVHFTAISFYTYLFQGEMAEYYLLPVFVFFFISLSQTLIKLPKYLLWLLLIFFAYINIQPLMTAENPYGLKAKKEVVKTALAAIDTSIFNMESFQTCWYSGGYRYLFTRAGREPVRSYMDQYLSEYYTPDPNKETDRELIILTPELVGENPAGYEAYRRQVISTSEHLGTFGAMEVYLR